jgi:AraC family transcriptional regulator
MRSRYHDLARKHIPLMSEVLQIQTVFRSELLSIRYVVARPTPAECEDVEREAVADLLLLPVSGMFARHDDSRRHVIANPNHALFLGYQKPYRMSYPGAIGDECLVLDFSTNALANLLTETVGVQSLYSPILDTHCLLSPQTMLDRDLLWRHLAQDAADSLAIEEISVSLLAASVKAACKDGRRRDRARHVLTMLRRQRQVEKVKEVISLYPTQEWTLGALARHADTSPFHLARTFREDVGVPVHQYLIRTRLGKALAAIRAGASDLTHVALEAGFAHHSHFTSRFRSLYGMTPSQLRDRWNRGDAH